MSKTTVTMYSRANDTPANNIAAKESWGHKRRENLFINSFVGTSTGGISYVNSRTRATNDQQGTIVNTGVVSDIGIDGAGLLAVSDEADGVVKYTRRGDFRQDELGYWKNGADQLLKAWRLDGQGNRPQNSSLLSSLEAVNFANTKGLPVKTSVISIAMNLNADQKALRGPGPENGFVMQRSGNNKGTKAEDILLPDQIGRRALRLGDAFTFTSSGGDGPKTVTYGGITVGNKASNATTIFGASSANATFGFQAVAAAGAIVDGQQLRISIQGGASYTFTAMSGQPTGTNFNSVQSLANAINKISVLNARVVDDRLYIAPKDASKGLTYQNVGGGTNIVETLGLRNLAPAALNENRFNSVRTLRDAVNTNQSTDSLLATIEPGDNIKITSLLSTSSLRVAGNQVDGNRISRAITNPTNNPVGGGSVFIEARGSGLQPGDLVRITNMNDVRIPDAVYSVGTANDNGFTISITGGGAAYNQPNADLVVPANATWQIAAGIKNPVQAGNITQASAGGDIRINLVGHGLNNNDVIYTDGGVFDLNIANIGGGGVANKTITLPAGYYIVTNAGGGNDFDITPTNVAGAGAGGGNAGLNFRKIGTDPAPLPGNGDFNTTVFTTGPGAGSTLVNYHIGSDNHGYAVGDSIRFQNVGAAFDGITLANNTDYNITAIGAGFITFDVAGVAGAGAAAAGAQAIPLSAQGTVRINNHSRLFEYFGLDPEKDSANPANVNSLFEATYNPTDIDKNLTGRNFVSTETFSHPVTVYNSKGSPSTFILYFAKLENNKWAVELAAQPDENGIFNVDGLAAPNGLVKYGTISFNQDGTLNVGSIEGFNEAVVIDWNDGSEPSSITIDFPNELSEIKTGNVSQVKNPNNVEIVQSDGQSAGTLLKLEVDPNGFIIGTFDSGETRKLYQIPIAIFANVNGLIAGANGTFEISRESGKLLLKQAGVGGAGRTLGGVLEASNTDTTEELLKVQELSNTIRANARVAATEFKNTSTVLNELNQ